MHRRAGDAAPGAAPAPGPRRLLALLGPVALGVVAGVVWWLAAPLGPGHAVPAAVDLTTVPAGRDAVFALTQLVAGALCAVALLTSGGAERPRRVLLVLAGSAVGALVALAVGTALGRMSGVAPGQARALGTLRLHAVGFLTTWPLLVALATFLTALVRPRGHAAH